MPIKLNREQVEAALTAAGGNLSGAGMTLGISRQAMARRLQRDPALRKASMAAKRQARKNEMAMLGAKALVLSDLATSSHRGNRIRAQIIRELVAANGGVVSALIVKLSGLSRTRVNQIVKGE